MSQQLSALIQRACLSIRAFGIRFNYQAHGTTGRAITAIVYDSRAVVQGAIFVALRGAHVDGHDYIASAIDAGATAIVHSLPLREYRDDVCYIRCHHPRLFLSACAHHFYAEPSHKLTVIGVTGTDGKSTVCYFLYQLLTACGLRCGLLTTVGYDIGDGLHANNLHQTTPEAPDVHRALAEMHASGCTHAVVEMSSHALSPRTARVAHVSLCGAILTTISHEHIDFHKSMRRYRADKARIFHALSMYAPYRVARPSGDRRCLFALSGANRGVNRYLARHSSTQIMSYRPEYNAHLSLTVRQQTITTSDIDIVYRGEKISAHLPVGGHHNIDNAMGAFYAASLTTGMPLGTIVAHAHRLRLPQGRMEVIATAPQYNFNIIIDYAHTPAAFSRLLPMIRGMTRGALHVLFGSAGERDVDKRAPMGRIAARWADALYLTDEDPRREPAENITNTILRGVLSHRIFGRLFARYRGKVVVIHDRAEAICHAVLQLKKNDTLLLLGKGHENSILYADGAHPWSEHDAVRDALAHL